MDTELLDDFLSTNHHIMELDYIIDADMVSPDSLVCEAQFDYDQVMAPIQPEDHDQEIEMMDDYPSASAQHLSLSIVSEPNVEREATSLPSTTSSVLTSSIQPFAEAEASTNLSDNMPISSSSSHSNRLTSSLNGVDEVPLDTSPSPFPLTILQEDSQVQAPFHLPNHNTYTQKAPRSTHPTNSSSEPDLLTPGPIELSELPMRTTPLLSTGSATEKHSPSEDKPAEVSLSHADDELVTSTALCEPVPIKETTGEISPDLHHALLPSSPEARYDELTTADEFCVLNPIDLTVDDLTTSDESFEPHPKPRIDLLEHVQTEVEILNLTDESHPNADQQTTIRQAACIRLICEGCDYSLFQRMPVMAPEISDDLVSSSTTEEETLLLGEPEHQSLYFAPLQELFETLRQIFPAFTETDHSELVLSFPELEARIPEDNIYARELTLYDMDRLHVGASLPSRLLINVEKQPRLIHRFNVLAKHVWKQASADSLDVEGAVDLEDEVGPQGELGSEDAAKTEAEVEPADVAKMEGEIELEDLAKTEGEIESEDVAKTEGEVEREVEVESQSGDEVGAECEVEPYEAEKRRETLEPVELEELEEIVDSEEPTDQLLVTASEHRNDYEDALAANPTSKEASIQVNDHPTKGVRPAFNAKEDANSLLHLDSPPSHESTNVPIRTATVVTEQSSLQNRVSISDSNTLGVTGRQHLPAEAPLKIASQDSRCDKDQLANDDDSNPLLILPKNDERPCSSETVSPQFRSVSIEQVHAAPEKPDNTSVENGSCTDATADGDEVKSVDTTDENPQRLTIEISEAHQSSEVLPASGPEQSILEQATLSVEPNDEDEVISNGTVLGYEPGSDEFEELTNEAFHALIDNSSLSDSVAPQILLAPANLSFEPSSKTGAPPFLSASVVQKPASSGFVVSPDLPYPRTDVKKRPVDSEDEGHDRVDKEQDSPSSQSADGKRLRTC